MLIARMFRYPGRKQLGGSLECKVELPAGCPVYLKKISEHEYQVIAVPPLPRVNQATKDATMPLFEGGALDPWWEDAK